MRGIGPVYPAPGGRASQPVPPSHGFPGGSLAVHWQFIGRPALYLASANEPVPGSRRLLGNRPLFRRPMGDETELDREETILGVGEDSRKLALATSPTNETTGREGP